MQRGNASVVFLVVLAGAAAFIWFTSAGLPDLVASHFAVSGAANGFMPRVFYERFMLGFVVLLPCVVVFVPTLGLDRLHARIHLPNRDYWLAPARRAATVRVLRDHMVYIGCLLVAFLAYVHWLVVSANQVVPPALPMPWFYAGAGAFAVAAIGWALALIGRFRHLPQ